MIHRVSILHLEDDPIDAELVQATLEAADSDMRYEIHCVQTQQEFELALHRGKYDLILADYRLPGYNGTSALRFVQRACPDTPFIFVSGTMGEDAAIEGLTEGATDYVLKQKLSRLVPAIRRALEDMENRRERSRAENALQESLEKFRAVAESANEGIISVDRQGTIVYWNRAASLIFGYTPEEVLGQPVYLIMAEKYDTWLRDPHLWDSSSILLQIGKILEVVGRRKDGSEVPVEISVATWNTREGTFYTGMIRDVTEQKQAEAKLRLLSAALEAAANAVVITDREGTITWTNPAFTQLTGYTREEATGKNPRILKSGKQAQQYYHSLWETILSGKVWHNEVVNQHKDGHLYVEEMTIAPVQQQPGEISHFVAIKQDISERKHHEQEREAIISVANAMRTMTTRVELVTAFLNQIKDLFAADGAMLATPDPNNGEIVIEMGCGATGERFSGLRMPPGQGSGAHVLSSGKPYRNNHAETDPLFFRADLLGSSRAVVGVPLFAEGNAFGALWMARRTDISESEVNLLTAIANLAANAIHRVTLHEQTEQQLRQMAALHQIDTAINAGFDLKNMLNILLNNVVQLLGVDAADVLLLAPSSLALEFAAGAGFSTADIEKTRVPLGEGQAGRAALERRILAFPDLNQVEGTFSRSLCLAGEKFVSHVIAPLVAKGQVKGVLEVFQRRRLEPAPEWYNFFEALATQAAIAIDNANLFNDLQHSNSELTQAYHATIEGWALALDLRDKETEGHTRRVTEMTLRLARAMGVYEGELVNMRRGAILHDIGKMGIPDNILFKPSFLTDEEWVVMRKHPVYAYEMLSPIHYLQPALDIPYCHHEKWDGSGYPLGLAGERIPLAARIFAIIDVWDALRANRRYREAWEEEKVLDYIRQQSGKHFDPHVVEVFLAAQPWRETKSQPA